MERLLLKVEDRFLIPDRGVLIVPSIRPELVPQNHHLPLLLKFPDGTRRSVEASFTLPFVTPPQDLAYTCLLKGLDKLDEVPVGTEIWVNEE